MPSICGAEWDRKGATREVFLVGRFAIKVPRMVYGWPMFLKGLLANMQEVDFSKTGWPELCPVVFSLPGGWLIVMRRAQPISRDYWAFFDPEKFCEKEDRIIPAEHKLDSFGWLDGRVVAVDYGN
jgi:hypothetical protein